MGYGNCFNSFNHQKQLWLNSARTEVKNREKERIGKFLAEEVLMNAETEILTEEKLEKVEEQKPVAVYSVNFAEALGNFTEKRLVRRRKSALGKKSGVEKAVVEKSLSQKIFNWRNAVPAAAILAIGVLHFAFQISVIRPEVSENRALMEVPPVKAEPARAVVPVEAVPAVPAAAETKDAEPVAPQKTAVRTKSRQFEAAPQPAPAAKPAVRKKEAVESRAERLRRAEKILTGI